MIYPDNFEEKIGFDTIREMLRSECRNEISRYYADEISFSVSHGEIVQRLSLTQEYLRMLREVYGYPDPVVEDLTYIAEKITIPGSWFEPELLPDFHEALAGIRRYLDFFLERDDFPLLKELSAGIYVDEELVVAAGALLDDQGGIRDSASPELAAIRKEINSARSRSEKMLRKILKSAVDEGVLPKDTEYSVKNGRFVIPVPAAKKRQVKGYIHDESATGQTVYIEPAEVLELFNALRELELAERREVIRIMIKLADLLRPHIPEIGKGFRYAGMLDFIRSKAKLAMKINAVMPEIAASPHLDWKRAVHPLLFLSFLNQGREVVPLDISLEEKDRILIISGPNAGGKSVCLKTVGLLQYMLQCGMLIPVHHNSVAGIFKSLFIDIGDEQSLENDLSTYSSHLLNLKTLLEHADESTLFLIDEMGSGTEPNTGGAIAEAALEMTAAKGAFGVVTTHYANLKLMAGKVPGVVNGAMLFDTGNMQPLYIMRTGKPGSSFAFEIAGKTGMPGELINRAKEKVGKAHYEFEMQIQNLEVEKELLDRKQQELKVADAFVAEMIEKYTSLYQKLNESRKEIIQQAKREAEQIIKQSNRIIEKTIKEIREAGAEKSEVKRLREELTLAAGELVNADEGDIPVVGRPQALSVEKVKKKEVERKKPRKPSDQISAGDIVTMKGHAKPGEVLQIQGSKALVAFGSMKMKVNLAELEAI